MKTPDWPPWLEPPWQRLRQALSAGRLPHALLVAGSAGVGKRRLVERLMGALLCARPGADDLACGRCADCALLAAGTHPDRLRLVPNAESKSQEIRVDAVRALIAAETLTAHRGRWKTVMVDPAQRLNGPAANALLKTLEEPAPATLICLVSEQPNRLPATLRSRCQRLSVPQPPEDQALAWLAPRLTGGDPLTLLRLAQGAPWRALALAEAKCLEPREPLLSGFLAVSRGQRDPITEAGAWSQQEPAVLLDWLGGWLSDLVRLRAGQTHPRLTNPDKAEDLTALAARLDPASVHRYLQRVWETSAEVSAPLNWPLVCESLLIAWTGLVQASRAPG